VIHHFMKRIGLWAKGVVTNTEGVIAGMHVLMVAFPICLRVLI
jgi:hypothetical protein